MADGQVILRDAARRTAVLVHALQYRPQESTRSEERTVSVDLHVYPLDDLIAHTLDDECPCGPEDRPVERKDGSIGWLAVHHSLDGREQREQSDDGDETATA